MKHRYGRHGDKAWLRWRKKHFRRTSLTPAPQMAVLHVPLEFLSRIRKVIILMDDGSELNIGSQVSSTVNGDTDKLNVAVLGQISSPEERFLAAARGTAKQKAKKAFTHSDNPYRTQPNEEEARTFAQLLYYYGNDNMQPLQQKWSLDEAEENYLRVFKAEYEKHICELSVEHKAATEETKTLLVFARTDKKVDKGIPPEYADDRARARAYISLGSNGFLRQEDLNEHVFDNSHERVRLYQKFYDEFKPAKEED